MLGIRTSSISDSTSACSSRWSEDGALGGGQLVGSAHVPECAAPAPAIVRGVVTVAVCEDDAALRSVLTRSVKAAGHEVVVAHTGGGGAAAASRRRPPTW